MDRNGEHMRKFLGGCALVAILCAFGTASGQTPDPDYVLTVGSGVGPSGSQQEIVVGFENPNGNGLQGWSFGVCHNQAEMTVIDALPGATNFVAKNGDEADFIAVQIFPEGPNIGVVVCLTGCAVLPAGTDYEWLNIFYQLDAPDGTMSTMFVCDETGDPPVLLALVDEFNNTVIPVTVEGIMDIGGAPPYALISGNVMTTPDSTVSVPITLQNPEGVDGYSMGLGHSAQFATLDSIDQGAAVAALNGGSGAAFFQTNVTPAGGDGGTIGCVIDFMAAEVIPAGDMNEVALYNYSISGSTPGQTTIDLQFTDLLGIPPVTTVLAVGPETVFPETVDGTIFVDGIPPPFLFIRGDTNNDGVVDVSDAIFLANWLFATGPMGTCDASGDVDDSGALEGLIDTIYLLTFLFNSGPPVAPPYPGCGGDPTDDLECDSSSC